MDTLRRGNDGDVETTDTTTTEGRSTHTSKRRNKPPCAIRESRRRASQGSADAPPMLTQDAWRSTDRVQNVHRGRRRRLLRGGGQHANVDRILHLDQEPFHGARNVPVVPDRVGRVLR
eukprot:scaffold574_cov333-Pavlova_lutheri.AAC.7